MTAEMIKPKPVFRRQRLRRARYLYDLDGHTVFKALPGGTVEEKKYDKRGN